jgi:hypothetical protein
LWYVCQSLRAIVPWTLTMLPYCELSVTACWLLIRSSQRSLGFELPSAVLHPSRNTLPGLVSIKVLIFFYLIFTTDVCLYLV